MQPTHPLAQSQPSGLPASPSSETSSSSIRQTDVKRLLSRNRPSDTAFKERMLTEAKSLNLFTISTTQPHLPSQSDEELFFPLPDSVISSLRSVPIQDVKPSREQTWQKLSEVIQNLSRCGQLNTSSHWQDDEAFNTALNDWLSQFPCVLNIEKVATALKQTSKERTDPQKILNVFSHMMSSFQVAETLTAEKPEAVFTQLPVLQDALLALLIFRHKLVHETPEEKYLETVEKLDLQIQRTLYRRFGDQLKARAGLDINTTKPDYAHLSRLVAISGYETPAAGLDNCILATAQDKPDGPLNTLITLDAWLAENDETPNMVVWGLGAALLQDYRKVGEKLPDIFSSAQPTTTIQQEIPSLLLQRPRTEQKNTPRRIRFNDQQTVIPADQTRRLTLTEQIEDVPPPARPDLVSHISVQYFSLLNEMLRSLETEPPDNAEHWETLQNCLDEAQTIASIQEELNRLHKQYPVLDFAPEEIETEIKDKEKLVKHYCTALVNMTDSLMTQMYGEKGRKLARQERAHRLSELSYVKAGLVDKNEFTRSYEQHLEKTLVKSLLPRRSQRYNTEIHEYNDVRGTNQDTKAHIREERPSADVYPPVPSYLQSGRVLKGLPQTSDLMTSMAACSRPYHQAMEVDISSVLAFCANLVAINDPRTMLALLARIQNTPAAQPLIESWQQRMKEVMMEHCAQRLLAALNLKISTEVKEKLGSERPMEVQPDQPLTPSDEKISLFVQEQVDTTVTKYLNLFRGGQIETWITKNGFDRQSLKQVWDNGLIKPTRWPPRLDDMINRFLPSGKDLANYLTSNHMVA